MRPVAIGAEDKLSLGMELAPLLEEECQALRVRSRKRLGGLALQLLFFGGCLVEALRARNGTEELGKVAREHVGHEPRDGLGVQDDVGRQAGGQKVSSENEVDVELESGVVEHDIDAALSLALGLGLLQELVDGGEVVDNNVLLGRLAGLGALQLLNVFVRQARQERQVGGVTPEADFAHFGEEQLLGGLVLGGALVLVELLDELLVL